MTIGEELATYFHGLEFNDLPGALVAATKEFIFDYLGVALGGSSQSSAVYAANVFLDMGGRPDARILGQGTKLPAPHAAFVNAVASHSIELDDVDPIALYHFGPPVLSAALAAGELVGANGREFLTALIAGCEMMARLNNAVNPALRNRGFHTTATCGTFGAAVAAAKLLGLDQAQITSAIGLAGAHASGLMEMYGPSMQKRFNPGPAAHNGILAALFARAGFTGAATILEGERGFGRAFSGQLDKEKLTAGLGRKILVDFEFKRYSCARPIHTAIDCALDIRPQVVELLEQIEQIKVWRHPDWAHYHLNPTPGTFHEAQVSLPYSVAVSLVKGEALLSQYDENHLNNPLVVGLAAKVAVEPDASLSNGITCRMEVITKSGTKFPSLKDYPRGSLQNPLSKDDLFGKFRILIDGRFDDEQIELIWAQVQDLENQTVGLCLDSIGI